MQLGGLAMALLLLMLLRAAAIARCRWNFGETRLALALGSYYGPAGPIMSVLAGTRVAGAMTGISISLLYARPEDWAVMRANILR